MQLSMPVLHLLDHGLPLHSGHAFRTRAILKAELARGWEVAAVTGPRHGLALAGEEAIDGLRFFRTRPTGAALPGLREWREIDAFDRRIRQVVKRFQPDVLHAHSPALRVQAALSPVADRIRFLGRVPHEAVERYYSLIDVLVYPRKKMRLTDLIAPLKPLEAMAQRRLVAASDVGGTAN